MQSSSIYSGLPNLGNTCYVASSLQCFLHIPRLLSFFALNPTQNSNPNSTNPTPTPTPNINPSQNPNCSLLTSTLTLTSTATSSTTTSTTNVPFLQTLSFLSQQMALPIPSPDLLQAFQAFLEASEDFCDGTQQDAQEFLKYFLEKIDKLTNKGNPNLGYKPFRYQMNKADVKQQKENWIQARERDNSIITEVFCGQMASSVVCTSCRTINKVFEDFWDVSLSFRDTSSQYEKASKKEGYNLGQMIDNFLRKEEIKGRTCGICRVKSTAQKSLEITRYPNILILHLKRFYYKEDRREKLNYGVKFPVKNLAFNKLLDGKPHLTYYNLIGIIHHIGELENGHYYAECKDPNSQNWFLYSDDNVDFITMNSEECIKKGSETGYIFFYEKNK